MLLDPNEGARRRSPPQKNQYTNMACDRVGPKVLKPTGWDDASELETLALDELLCAGWSGHWSGELKVEPKVLTFTVEAELRTWIVR